MLELNDCSFEQLRVQINIRSSAQGNTAPCWERA